MIVYKQDQTKDRNLMSSLS